MKKLPIAILAIFSATALSAMATPPKLQQCPFADNFYTAGALIQKINANGNLAVNLDSPTEFTAGCADNNNGNGGNIYVTVAGNNGFCSLVITDGPYQMNPNVTSSNCQGNLQYNGMDHAYGTYDYTLKFSGQNQKSSR